MTEKNNNKPKTGVPMKILVSGLLNTETTVAVKEFPINKLP